MKINDLLKQLNALKKQHGNIDVTILNGMTGYPQAVLSISTIHPYDKNMCYDRSKPVHAVIL